ncbi:glycoside hydrolase family 32 protein [Paenibacillus methanolicus]|uniref:Sucrose-6-phosphate hydrolase n=1 Tax=Paenibacillus methanolicus TaxID=582686 RepID=A0A5S5BY13_9BACL|nr:glycoside hydrolase family 32 protein [Paenibacillus methanolicus]TYP71082.1 beta-fructofuranosidase [Paenibacillus methanolicus]
MTQTREYTREHADRFIRESKHLLRPDYRLNYHLMAEFGWMNDPNGFVHHDGQYHLFYQHYPYKPVWGPMHWGHAVSRDLIKWEYLPVALAPDTEFDRGGCFSGSAVSKDGKLYLMYTGHVVTGPDKDRDYKQSQGIAVSEDGVTFEKHARNPVIGYDQIPEWASQKDFRDPKVFERNGRYYVLLGSNDGAGNGLVLVYRSDDLMNWTFIGELARSDGQFGDNWECPDLFELGGKDVFMLSPQRMPAQGEQYRNLHSTMAVIGAFDSKTGRFEMEQHAQVDHGFDFYAPQSMMDEKGRRIVIGWMDMWETDMPTQNGHHWAGAMSLPREAVRHENRIIYRPVTELENYRCNAYTEADIWLDGERELPVGGDCYELEVVFEAVQAEQFGLKLRVGDGEETVLTYRSDDQLFRFNRDRSGIGPGGERRAMTRLVEGKLGLRIFVDKSSVEVFVGDGEIVMTGRIYPGAASTGLRLFSTGSCRVASLRKWDIE